MSVDFAVLSLPSASSQELQDLRDLRGERLDYTDLSPIVFLANANGIHWNLIRVVRKPKPLLQLFEPMGKPPSRHGGLSLRTLPQGVVQWLDKCCPISPKGTSWLSASVSVITKQQQLNGVDCGVACLLYAEKAGQGVSIDDIAVLSQEEITSYRKILQQFTRGESEEGAGAYFDESGPQSVRGGGKAKKR